MRLSLSLCEWKERKCAVSRCREVAQHQTLHLTVRPFACRPPPVRVVQDQLLLRLHLSLSRLVVLFSATDSPLTLFSHPSSSSNLTHPSHSCLSRHILVTANTQAAPAHLHPHLICHLPHRRHTRATHITGVQRLDCRPEDCISRTSGRVQVLISVLHMVWNTRCIIAAVVVL